MNHPTSVDGMTAQELATKFVATTYGYQHEFFSELARLYIHESKQDEKRGYGKLATLLSSLCIPILSCEKLLGQIWQICKPRTNKKTQ